MKAGKDKLPPKRRYRVGDHIQFPWGGHKIRGVVIEDRGNLAARGTMQVIRIRAQFSLETEPKEFELGEDDVELVSPSSE